MLCRILLSVLKRNIVVERFIRCNPVRFKHIEIKEAATDEPIKYSTSGAGKWKAIYSSRGEDYFSTPRIQPLVVVMSLTAFMVYFCILREENDLDDWLRELESNVPLQVEEAQLQVEITQRKKSGADVSFLEEKLKEIRQKQGKSTLI